MAVLKREEVLDDWGTLTSGAHGKAEEVLTATRDHIAETKAPQCGCREKEDCARHNPRAVWNQARIPCGERNREP